MFFTGSCSEDLNSSKKSSDELSTDLVKQSKPCQEKVLPPNDKAYENPNKRFSNSRQSVNQNEDTPHCSTWTSRNSKSHNSSNNSNKYLMNAEHGGDNSEKFSGLLMPDFSYKSNDTFEANPCMKTFKPNSKHPESSNTFQKKVLPTNDKCSENYSKSALNSRKYVDQNDMQMPKNSRSYSISNNSSNYHLSPKPDYLNDKSHKQNSNSVNSNSHIHTPSMRTFNSQSSKEFNSSNNSPKKFDKYGSNFKGNCNFQKPYSYNNTKEKNFHPSQHHESYRSNLNRNHPRYNSNSYNSKPSYRFDQNIKMQDDVAKYSAFDENLNSSSHSEDKNTEIKHHRLVSELDDTVTIDKETLNNFKITFKSVPDTLPDKSISSSSPISETLCLSTLSISPVPNISPVSVISNASPLFSPVSTLESTSNLSLSNVFDNPSVNNDSIEMLISSDDNFIPPPISCESASDKMLLTAEKNVTFLQKVRMSIF